MTDFCNHARGWRGDAGSQHETAARGAVVELCRPGCAENSGSSLRECPVQLQPPSRAVTTSTLSGTVAWQPSNVPAVHQSRLRVEAIPLKMRDERSLPLYRRRCGLTPQRLFR